MAAEGHNPGFHVLDEFVCEAMHAAWVPHANPGKQAQNPGMVVLEEIVCVAGTVPDSPASDAPKTARHASVEEIIKVEAHRLAAIIATSDDPATTMTRFEKLLLAEFSSRQNSSRPAPRKPPDAGA